MAFHIKHGPRFYRPLTPKNAFDWEVQFFRISWGTKRALDVGCGKASFMARINPENWIFGISNQKRCDDRFIMLHCLPLTFRVHIKSAYSKEILQRIHSTPLTPEKE